jgi:ubiquinone/menaquinone biosynthesis C-methylase UbiE
VTGAPERWQLEGASAELYERHLVPAMTLPWAVDLVERVGVRRGDRVLDVACGTGAVARVAAERVGDSGRVAGLDVNRGMLAVARSLQPARAARIEWHEGSALELPFDDREFGVVLCQLGLQFFQDRPVALLEMRRVATPGGRVAASVFSAIERNPATHALSDALDRHLGEGASLAKRNEHSLADPEELRARSPPQASRTSVSRRSRGRFGSRRRPNTSASSSPRRPWLRCCPTASRRRANVSSPS